VALSAVLAVLVGGGDLTFGGRRLGRDGMNVIYEER
jgi:hypothetical protein